MSKSIDELSKKNQILSKRLRDHGLDDSTVINDENIQDGPAIFKRTKVYQGVYRFRPTTFPLSFIHGMIYLSK